MRQPDAVNVGEIGADLPGVRYESVAVGLLHLEVRGKILRRGGEHQNRATLVGLAQQRNQFRSRPREIQIMNFDARFEGGIEFEQADHFGTARAIVSFALILETVFDEIQLIEFHKV